MITKRRVTRPSHSTVAAYLALAIALTSGASYAADKIGSKDIEKNAVRSKHVKPDALTGDDINEGTLSLPPSGPSGLTNVVVRSEGTTSTGQDTQLCQPGEVAVGGGGNANTVNSFLTQSIPFQTGGNPSPTGWLVGGQVPGGGSAQVFAMAVCASP